MIKNKQIFLITGGSLLGLLVVGTTIGLISGQHNAQQNAKDAINYTSQVKNTSASNDKTKITTGQLDNDTVNYINQVVGQSVTDLNYQKQHNIGTSSNPDTDINRAVHLANYLYLKVGLQTPKVKSIPNTVLDILKNANDNGGVFTAEIAQQAMTKVDQQAVRLASDEQDNVTKYEPTFNNAYNRANNTQSQYSNMNNASASSSNNSVNASSSSSDTTKTTMKPIPANIKKLTNHIKNAMYDAVIAQSDKVGTAKHPDDDKQRALIFANYYYCQLGPSKDDALSTSLNVVRSDFDDSAGRPKFTQSAIDYGIAHISNEAKQVNHWYHQNRPGDVFV